MLFCVGLLTLTACGQRREPAANNMDPEAAARLGLTEDAKDPTRRDTEAGYNRWKPKPEPVGTLHPLSPERRKIGGPNPSTHD